MQRWRDDSQLLDELGLDATAFDAPGDLPDLVALQRRLEARITEGAQPVLKAPPARPVWMPWVGTALMVAAAAGLWLNMPADTAPVPPSPAAPLAPEAAAEVSVPPAPAPEARPAEVPREVGDLEGKGAKPTVWESPRVAAPLPDLAPPPPAARAPARKRAPAPSAPPVAVEAPVSPQPPSSPPRVGDLQAQLALYEAGRDALRAGRHGIAIAHFEDYLKRFTDGELRREAEVSLLESLVRAGRHGRAAGLAGRLAKRTGLSHRRGEFLRVRAESLAHLGRCDAAEEAFGQAVQAQAGLNATGVLDALRHCRARETPEEVTR